MMKTVLDHARDTAVLFMLLLLVFRTIEQFRPAALRLPLLRRRRLNDLAWWVIGPLVSENLARVAALLVVMPIALLAYGRVDGNLILHGFGPLSRLPLWLQAPLALICGDFVGYWVHRALHGRRLWRFHAVHHATEALDWMSAVRNHPLNEAINRAATTLPVVALGFASAAVGGVLAVIGVLALVAHANVDWDWGPLRTLLISPRFHRWHHEIGGRATCVSRSMALEPVGSRDDHGLMERPPPIDRQRDPRHERRFIRRQE